MVGSTLTLNSSSMLQAGTTQFGVVEFDSSGDLVQTGANSGIANIGTNKVTYTKIQQVVGAKKLLGSQTATTNVAEIGLYNGLDMVAGNLSIAYPNVSISASTSVTNGNTVYLVDTTAGPITLTLPAASTVSQQLIFVKDSAGSANTNNITVQSAGGLVDNVTSLIISKNYGPIIFYSNGTNWYAVSFNNIDNATVSLGYAGYFSSTSTTLPNATNVVINVPSFASVIDPLVNISVSTGVFTVQQSGRFTVSLTLTQSGGNTGNFTIFLYKGASTLISRSNISYGFTGGWDYNMGLSWVGLLNANDTLTLKYTGSSSSGNTIIKSLNFSIIQLPINL